MITVPKCYERGCIHLIGVKSDPADPQADGPEGNERNVCRAFPDGIPEEISHGDNPHLKPVKGDHDIRFEKRPILEAAEKDE